MCMYIYVFTYIIVYDCMCNYICMDYGATLLTQQLQYSSTQT